MILSYRDKQTAQFAAGGFVRTFQGFTRQAYKRLEILTAATSLNDLRGLRSNRLEALKGERAGSTASGSTTNGGSASNGPRTRPGHRMLKLSITIRKAHMARPPIHPGEILGDELTEIGVSANQLAQQLNVPANRISQIIAGKRSITGDTALRLGHWFKNSAEFWLNLQTQYDLRLAEKEAGKEIEALPVMPKTKKQQQPTLG